MCLLHYWWYRQCTCQQFEIRKRLDSGYPISSVISFFSIVLKNKYTQLVSTWKHLHHIQILIASFCSFTSLYPNLCITSSRTLTISTLPPWHPCCWPFLWSQTHHQFWLALPAFWQSQSFCYSLPRPFSFFREQAWPARLIFFMKMHFYISKASKIVLAQIQFFKSWISCINCYTVLFLDQVNIFPHPLHNNY